MVFHGNGGYDWNTLYNMPIWLRKFTFNKIKEYYDKQNEEAEAQRKMLENKGKPEISRPDVVPTYSTKAAKK
jgi:hypothetical protein